MWTAMTLFWLFDSTETAIHNFLEKPLYIYIFKTVSDLSKAYDVLNHKILMSKLDAYGIRGIVNLWLKSLKLQTACQNKLWWQYQDYKKICLWFKQN